MALCIRIRLLKVLIRIRLVSQWTAFETGQLPMVAVVEDGLTSPLPDIGIALASSLTSQRWMYF